MINNGTSYKWYTTDTKTEMEDLTMTEQQIENKLYDFLMEKMYTGEAEEIEDVKRFKGYLCTMNNGIVVDCTDGTQICLTIQTR